MNLLSPHTANLLAKSDVFIGTVGCGHYWCPLISDTPCWRKRMRGHLYSPHFIVWRVWPSCWKSFFQPCFCNTITSAPPLLGPHPMPAFPALNTHTIGLPIMAALLSYTSDICLQGANLMHSAPCNGYVRMMVNSTTRGHAFELRTSFCSTARTRLFNLNGGCGCLAGIIGDRRRYKKRWLLE